MRIVLFIVLLLVFITPSPGHSEPVEAQIDTLQLEFLENPKRWSPWESTVTLEEELLAGRPIIKQHITIDHFGGDEKYPIGWPRMYFAVKGDEGKWLEYDALQFQVRADVSRPSMKNIPLTLQIKNLAKEMFRMSIDPVHGQWKTITILLADLPAPQQIIHFGFNISDSNYQHGDVLDFRFSGFKLTRSTLCQVDNLQITGPAIFSDRGCLNLQISISGPAAEAARGVPFQIQQGDKILRQETLPVVRGRSTMEMDVSELRLAPGSYILTAFAENPELRKDAAFTIIQSPWEDKK